MDCQTLVADIITAESAGPIPVSHAQRWWATSLQDLRQACSAITTAANAESQKIDSGITGYYPATMVPGAQAVADLTAGSKLLTRTVTYVSAKS